MAYQDTLDIHALAQEHLNKAVNFQQMGMAASAEHELAQAHQLDPAIVSDARYQSLSIRKAEEQSRAEALKLPMRVAAILLLIDAGITALLWLLNLINAAGRIDAAYLVSAFAHVSINVFVVINLLKQKETAPRLTMWWAVLGLVAGGLAALAWSQVLSLILQITYSGALLLLVLGKPSSRRVAFAVVVFVIGYLGGLCGVFARAVIR